MLETILAEIDAEIAKLQQARALLATGVAAVNRGPGRPKTTPGAVAPKKAKRRTMSPEAREKIRQAQLKRWAVSKKSPRKQK